jgi:cation diffusion facilitator family transporter
VNGTLTHRHGPWTHEHHHHGPHRHAALPFRSHEPDVGHDHQHEHDHDHQHEHEHEHEHGHTHGRVDRSIVRSRAGVRAVSISLAVLGVTAALQAIVFMLSGSVALLADLIHNGGDALTAIPLAIAFLVRSERGERWAGYAVVLAIFVSASVAAIESVDRLLHPQHLHYLGALAVAGVIGFAGNELAARVRLRAGRRLESPALLADGQHARVDGFVSLGVVASAVVVALGLRLADPLIGLAITALILRITLQAWRTIRASLPD